MSDLRMPDTNLVIISGRLTRDPEIKQGNDGKPWARFSLAHDRRIKKDGQWEKHPMFINCTAWGFDAEAVAKLGKGRPVQVQGELTENAWTGKDGNERKQFELHIRRVQPLDWDEKDAHRAAQTAPRGNSAPVEIPEPLPEDDIPF